MVIRIHKKMPPEKIPKSICQSLDDESWMADLASHKLVKSL